jgi:hypothetical protein
MIFPKMVRLHWYRENIISIGVNPEHLTFAKKTVVGWRSLCVAQTSRSLGI